MADDHKTEPGANEPAMTVYVDEFSGQTLPIIPSPPKQYVAGIDGEWIDVTPFGWR